MQMRKIIAAAGIGVAAVALVGCGEQLKDAPSGRRYSQPMDYIEMSDQFSNIGTKCVPMMDGKRMFVSSNDQGSRPVIVDDPGCKAEDR